MVDTLVQLSDLFSRKCLYTHLTLFFVSCSCMSLILGISNVYALPDALGSSGSRDFLASLQRQHVFDLSDFGAVGDGVTDNTRVFQNAVYAVSGVADKGGGQLYVPPGRFVTGSFNLTSNMTLYLARDATILGSKDPKRWPLIAPLPSYGRGRELPGPRHSSLLCGHGLKDVVITGENGTIDGQGFEWWQRASLGQLAHTRGSLVELLWSHHVLLSNITLVNSPFWTFHPVYCNDVQVMDVTIHAPEESTNTDGIVTDSCSNTVVNGAHIVSGGDGISVKSGWDEYGISFNAPSTNIRFENVVVESPKGAGFSVGSEMSGGVTGVTLRNAVILKSKVGILLKTSQGRGGFVRGIDVHGVVMRNVETGIHFLSDFGEHPDNKFDPNAFPVVQNVTISDLNASDVGRAAVMDGLAKSPFIDILLNNVSFQLRDGGSGFSCSFISGWAIAVVPAPCPELEPSLSFGLRTQTETATMTVQ